MFLICLVLEVTEGNNLSLVVSTDDDEKLIAYLSDYLKVALLQCRF